MDHGNLIGKRSKNDKLQERLLEDCQTWITPKEILSEIPGNYIFGILIVCRY